MRSIIASAGSNALYSHPSGGFSVRKPALLEHLERAVGVLGLDQEVDVVVGVGPAPGVDGDAAGQGERDLGVAERARGAAHRVEQGFEVVRHVHAVPGEPPVM